jgi:hypothetical protein
MKTEVPLVAVVSVAVSGWWIDENCQSMLQFVLTSTIFALLLLNDII